MEQRSLLGSLTGQTCGQDGYLPLLAYWQGLPSDGHKLTVINYCVMMQIIVVTCSLIDSLDEWDTVCEKNVHAMLPSVHDKDLPLKW